MPKYLAALLAASALLPAFAQAKELRPMQAASISLGDVSGVAYYTEEGDGYRVVTTLSAGENTPPVRFITTLTAGQKAVVSVPREPGLSALTVEIARANDRVLVSSGDQVTGLESAEARAAR